MSKWIDAEALYDEVKKREETARQWVIDTPSAINGNLNPAAIRYAAILGERTTIMHMIFDAPAADVAPVRHGRWEPDGRGEDAFWVCSACRFPSAAFAANILYKFCPNCGAKMEASDEET